MIGGERPVLIDTGSTLGYDALKANIGTFVESLSKGDANNAAPVRDWRAKAVGFRDFEHDPQAFVDNPFVSDVEALIKDLSELNVGDPVVHSAHGIGRTTRARASPVVVPTVALMRPACSVRSSRGPVR